MYDGHTVPRQLCWQQSRVLETGTPREKVILDKDLNALALCGWKTTIVPEFHDTPGAHSRWACIRVGRLDESAGDHSRSRSENHSIAATISGQRRLAPPGNVGLGSAAMTSNRPA